MYIQTVKADLYSAATVVLDGVTDVFRLSTSSNEHRDIVMGQLFQLHASHLLWVGGVA